MLPPRGPVTSSFLSPSSVRPRALLLGFLGLFVGACGGSSETEESGPSRASQVVVSGSAAVASGTGTSGANSGPVVSPATASEPGSDTSAKAPPAELPPPNLGALAFQTPVYPEMRFSDERLGYLRQGAKVPADTTPEKRANCKDGWYKLAQGGYVCGKYATLNLENPRVKLGVRQPDLKTTVPYQYAYNRFHGTPLYKSLPTREEMYRIEPHLEEKEKERREAKAKKEAAAAGSASAEPAREGGKHKPEDGAKAPAEGEDGNVPTSDVSDATQAVAAVSAIAPSPPAEGEAAPDANANKEWWQTDEKNPNVSLADLEKGRGGSLDKRMVKGFFIAVDKTLAWSGRTFYRTTSGLLAPSDRMWINKPPESKGATWPDEAKGFFFVLSDKASKFELNKAGDKMADKGKLPKQTPVALTGKTLELAGTNYLESVDGFWVKAAAGTTTEPGKRPDEVGADERWVDVNLSKKTLVLFQGDKPIYAALISPGKHSRNKKKDHSTPTGSFRVREKHLSTTMDGDGASGDLPYSIEDVPYVAYFKGSYALHAAFWHSNFGREMSHGCVNLSPKDAKFVFDFIDPQLPVGWHGVFATKDRKGSLVVLHE